MPKIVDHDERRAEIAACAVKAIAQHGLDGVKLEHVAELSGWTTGSLMHFFSSKDAILTAALGHAVEQLGARYEAAIEESDVVDALCCVLPLDAARRREWGVWVAYWGVVAFRDHVQSANHSFYEQNRSWIRRILEAAIERGEIRSKLDLESVIDHIIGLTDGIGVRATLDKKAWPAKRQRDYIATYIALLRK